MRDPRDIYQEKSGKVWHMDTRRCSGLPGKSQSLKNSPLSKSNCRMLPLKSHCPLSKSNSPNAPSLLTTWSSSRLCVFRGGIWRHSLTTKPGLIGRSGRNSWNLSLFSKSMTPSATRSRSMRYDESSVTPSAHTEPSWSLVSHLQIPGTFGTVSMRWLATNPSQNTLAVIIIHCQTS